MVIVLLSLVEPQVALGEAALGTVVAHQIYMKTVVKLWLLKIPLEIGTPEITNLTWWHHPEWQ